MVDEEFTGALSALAHETRVDILRALADAESALTFTELRSRVGATDSGRFNYHLRQLRDHFVRESDEGYALTYRGRRVVVAGTTGVSVTEPDATADPCPVCGDDDCDRLVHLHLAPGP